MTNAAAIPGGITLVDHQTAAVQYKDWLVNLRSFSRWVCCARGHALSDVDGRYAMNLAVSETPMPKCVNWRFQSFCRDMSANRHKHGRDRALQDLDHADNPLEVVGVNGKGSL